MSMMFHLKRLEGGREPVLDFLDSGSLSCSTTWIKEESEADITVRHYHLSRLLVPDVEPVVNVQFVKL